MWSKFKKIIFLLDPETAHHLAAYVLRALGIVYLLKSRRPGLLQRSQRFSLAGFTLDSPLGVAAGFDKNGEYILGLKVLGFGFVEVGTVTPLPQAGNPLPRLFRVPEAEALINRMGFNSQGADLVARRLEQLRGHCRLHFPLGINLGKNKETPLDDSASDYEKSLERLYPWGDYFVVNISSPNTPGLTGLQEGEALLKILQRTRAKRDQLAKSNAGATKPLLLKLSPDLTDAAVLKAAQMAIEQDFAGVIAANTSIRRDFPQLINSSNTYERGGLSGLPLAPRSKELCRLLRKALGAGPLIVSVGGINSLRDVEERLELGANLVQAYTGFIYAGPKFPQTVAHAFSKSP